MLWGVGIGDALGMPVEMWTYERIAKEHGIISDYKDPKSHKYFQGIEAGTITDDMHLTISTIKGLIYSGVSLQDLIEGNINIVMDSIAKYHVECMDNYGVAGWGTTTRKSVENLKNGMHWKDSAVEGENKGLGNGILMKLSPIAAIRSLCKTHQQINNVMNLVDCFSNMTHGTDVALCSSKIHVECMSNLFGMKDDFSPKKFIIYPKKYIHTEIENKLQSLKNGVLSLPEAIAEFGAGTCYCVNSLLFSYNAFMFAPNSVQSVVIAASSGGDTDSNAAIVGSMVGVLNGDVFSSNLKEGLKCPYDLDKVSDDFFSWLNS